MSYKWIMNPFAKKISKFSLNILFPAKAFSRNIWKFNIPCQNVHDKDKLR